MDFLFSRTYKYTVNQPIDNVLQDFSKVTNKKWTDFSDNITGTLNNDNTFKFTHKWTFGYIRGIFGNDFATIKGSISSNGQDTVIETTLRPNFGLVFFIYLIAILFLCELFGIKTMLNGPKTYILLFLPFFELILYGLILFMTNGLRNTFEKVFHLQTY
ncbi:hypothetical protein ACFOW1_10305 [Parasediminibacterium paludis]|uniref:Uncharacterized protein n=1 Tax=Parasediminibacterium paludis TaxID=908966 RepID=A0ABV8PVX6_9BACT